MRARGVFRWIAAVIAIVASTVPAAAIAAPPTDPAAEERRNALFEEGRTLHLAGKHAEAVEKLKAVVAIRKSPQALRALALAELKAGKLLDARDHLRDGLRLAEDGGPATEVEPTKTALAQVEPLVPKIRLAINGDTGSARILVDRVVRVPHDDVIDVDPGAHTIDIEIPGRVPYSKAVTVAEKGEAKIDLDVRQLAFTTHPRKSAGIALVVAGGMTLAVGAVTGGLAIAKHDELGPLCPGGICPDTAQQSLDTFRTLGVVSTVGLVVGGAATIAGAALWITAPKSATSVGQAHVIVAPGRVDLKVQF